MTLHECPKCGAEMQLEEQDPDVGVLSSYWFCDCGHTERVDYADYDTSDLDRP